MQPQLLTLSMIHGAYSFLLEDAMEVEVFASKKNKKKSEKKSLYLDENPLNTIQNDQSFEENGYADSAGGEFHYRNPNES